MHLATDFGPDHGRAAAVAEAPAVTPGGKPPPALERTRGAARIGFKLRDGATVLADLVQSGAARVRLPRRHAGEIAEAVVINTSGGLTDGDSLTTEIAWGGGTTAAVASQAAERIYRSRGADARIETRLDVGAGAAAFWLPQETILFDGGRLRRRCVAELGASARLLAAESIVFGRTAMGETVTGGSVRERLEIWAGGRLIWADAFALGGEIAGTLDRPAVGAGARALATLVAAGPDPGRMRDMVRALPAREDVRQGATIRGGLVVARLLASDGTALRPALVAAIAALKAALLEDRPDIARAEALPRVWAL